MANYNWENARTLRNRQYSTLAVLIIDNLRNISFARNRQFNVKDQAKISIFFGNKSKRN